MIAIEPVKNLKAHVTVPGSKSYSHRLLIAAALSNGRCRIGNLLHSEDTLLTLNALRQMGVAISADEQEAVVTGASGVLQPCAEPIYLANSGTSMRLLTAVAALGSGEYHLTGSERMSQRPIQDLLAALGQMGVCAQAVNHNGCPPLKVSGGPIRGGRVALNCGVSSQYLSALLLIAPYTQQGLDIAITAGPVSKPYIDMTVDVMRRLGVIVQRESYQRFMIPGHQVYQGGDYQVEPDCSNAGYFWAAAAVTGGSACVTGISRQTRQGDIRLLDLLEAMGCQIRDEPDGVMVSGGPLRAIQADMGDMPDMVPTLAVVAAFAQGVTVIENVAHLRAKESDRLAAVAAELAKMGINAQCGASNIVITGGTPRGTDIDTYNDHRIAMSFSVAGLKTPGVRIRNEACVEKSFPTYWQVFRSLYAQ